MDEPPAGLLLVGNKADLDEGGQREVLTETGETFAKVRKRERGRVLAIASSEFTSDAIVYSTCYIALQVPCVLCSVCCVDLHPL